MTERVNSWCIDKLSSMRTIRRVLNVNVLSHIRS